MAKRAAKIYSLEGKPVSKIDLPNVFATPIRPDIIKRAVLAVQGSRRQPQGRDPMAGKRTTAESRGTGGGTARIPRLKGGSARAAFAPGTVGGRMAHPPVVRKRIVKNLPKKERKLGLLSAIAATGSKELVKRRGHAVEDVPEIPLIVTDDLEELRRTKEVEETLTRLGILSELYRVKDSRNIRAGRGKLRGRKHKRAKGPLLVVAENKGIVEAAQNVPGVEVALVNNLNAELLAPGTHPGRFTIWTSKSVIRLGELYGKEEEE